MMIVTVMFLKISSMGSAQSKSKNKQLDLVGWVLPALLYH